MDPLSISASIVALLQLSGTVIGYLSDVTVGPKEKQKIRLELCSVLPMLSILQDQAEQAKNGDPWSSTLLSLGVPNGPIQQFRTALEELELKLAPVRGLKKIGKTFTWPFEKNEIQRILSIIERQKILFTLARQNDHIALAKAIKGDVEAVHNKINEIGDGVAKLNSSEKHHKIRQWLSGPDPSSNYNRALRKRHGGTGSWLIDNNVFRDWNQDPGRGSVIWLYGIPGCGKTILCSTILEHILQKYAPAPNTAVLYFFFDFNDIDKRQHERMIRSLLSQLSMHFDSAPPVLESLYSSCMNGGRQPNFEALLETFHQIATTFQNIFIILDALDECEEKPELLSDIEKLVEWEDTSLQILATSRREKEIEDSIFPLTKDEHRICIQSALVNADIRAYVHDQIQTNRKLQRWQKEPKVQLEIEDTLMKKANGMFRWAACQLDSLGSCLTLPKLRKALSTLPRTLNDTYARILCNIDEENQQYALHILQWLAFSVRPLHLEEISEVVAIDVNDTPQFDPDRRLPDPRDVVEICSTLITVTPRLSDNAEFDDAEFDDLELSNLEVGDSELGKSNPKFSGFFVILAHFSVKEYLTSDIIRQGQAVGYSLQKIDCQISLAKDCLAYLLHFDEMGSLPTEVFAKYPLARYAAENWTSHARVAEKKDNKLCQDFFLTKGKAFLNWIRLYSPDYPAGSNLSRSPAGIASPLYYASLTGLLESATMLIDKGVDINAQGGTHGSVLLAASSRGYDEVVQMLLENGADVNAQGGLYGNALIEASSMGYDKIVQMLLENGADVNAQDEGGNYKSALIAASSRGYDEVVQMLLENGADVNVQGGLYGNALIIASSLGYNKIVQMLLENGANVDAQDGLYGNALIIASSMGYDEIVQMLLENGADVNAQLNSSPENALLAAIEGDNEDIARLLIENGADITGRARNGNGTVPSPLEAASYRGFQRVVELILDKGVNVEVQGEDYSRALAEAAREGQQEICQILLGKRAVINAQVMTAARNGRSIEILQILLDHGGDLGDLSLQDAQGRALCHDASVGHSTIKSFEILLKLGSDLRVTDKQGRTCLHHAASSEYSKNIVIWLLKEGFDPNLPDRDGWTPLHWAAKCGGDAETIEILEDAGAKFSVEKIMGWTPDDVAVFHNHEVTWSKSNTAIGCDIKRLKRALEDGRSTASREADARGLEGQVFPGIFHRLDDTCIICDGCDLEICGPRHNCTDCDISSDSFDYCFKCINSSNDTHPGHTFTEIPGPKSMAI